MAIVRQTRRALGFQRPLTAVLAVLMVVMSCQFEGTWATRYGSSASAGSFSSSGSIGWDDTNNAIGGLTFGGHDTGNYDANPFLQSKGGAGGTITVSLDSGLKNGLHHLLGGILSGASQGSNHGNGCRNCKPGNYPTGNGAGISGTSEITIGVPGNGDNYHPIGGSVEQQGNRPACNGPHCGGINGRPGYPTVSVGGESVQPNNIFKPQGCRGGTCNGGRPSVSRPCSGPNCNGGGAPANQPVEPPASSYLPPLENSPTEPWRSPQISEPSFVFPDKNYEFHPPAKPNQCRGYYCQNGSSKPTQSGQNPSRPILIDDCQNGNCDNTEPQYIQPRPHIQPRPSQQRPSLDFQPPSNPNECRGPFCQNGSPKPTHSGQNPSRPILVDDCQNGKCHNIQPQYIPSRPNNQPHPSEQRPIQQQPHYTPQHSQVQPQSQDRPTDQCLGGNCDEHSQQPYQPCQSGNCGNGGHGYGSGSASSKPTDFNLGISLPGLTINKKIVINTNASPENFEGQINPAGCSTGRCGVKNSKDYQSALVSPNGATVAAGPVAASAGVGGANAYIGIPGGNSFANSHSTSYATSGNYGYDYSTHGGNGGCTSGQCASTQEAPNGNSFKNSFSSSSSAASAASASHSSSYTRY